MCPSDHSAAESPAETTDSKEAAGKERGPTFGTIVLTIVLIDAFGVLLAWLLPILHAYWNWFKE